MQTIPIKHIEPGCPYCDNDHDPGILCRVIANFPQHKQHPPRKPVKREVLATRDASGKVIAVKHVYREG